jgi:hypothetical protein
MYPDHYGVGIGQWWSPASGPVEEKEFPPIIGPLPAAAWGGTYPLVVPLYGFTAKWKTPGTQEYSSYWGRGGLNTRDYNLGPTPDFYKQNYLSPNGDFGASGEDNQNGTAILFRPPGDEDATDVRLVCEIQATGAASGNIHNSTQANGVGIAIWGFMNPDATHWFYGPDLEDGSLAADPYGSWHTRRSCNGWGAGQTEWRSANLAALYNEMRRHPGYTPGGNMFFALTGSPETWPGGINVRHETTQPFSLEITSDGAEQMAGAAESAATVTLNPDYVPLATGHTLRAEAGASEASVTLSPGADAPTLSGAASFTAPTLSGAPALGPFAAAGTFTAPTISAAPSLPTMAGIGAFIAPEILSPDTGHRIRAVAGVAQAIANLVPGADFPTLAAQSGFGAIALSAEVPLATFAGAGDLLAPVIGITLPTMAGVGAFVQPTLSGALALPTWAGAGTFRAPTISDGSAPPTAWHPWHHHQTPQKPWWTRRGGMFRGRR